MESTFTHAASWASSWQTLKRSAGLLALYGGLLSARPTQAQDYFIKDDFRTNSLTTFRIGGNAALTNTAGTGTTGYLQLTTSSSNQKGFAISKQTFNPTNGFSISFEYFSYGGSPGTDTQLAKGDGINLFLIDGTLVADAANFVPGGYGGSLGYAPLVAGATNTPGATGGFIGIGLDEFGGYSIANEGKTGGPGRVISGVAIRGAGNATTAAGSYPFIIGAATATYTVSGGVRTRNTGFGIDVATTRAQSASADYRRVFVDVFPVSKGATTYKVTVRIQNGPTAVATVIDNYTFTSATQVMPASLRIGFAASTGGSTNFHEVRDLAIVRPPVANNDVVSTSYNTAVSFSPLTNDEASGSSLDVATLDLDPSTVAINNTLTVPQGTFSIGSNGVVTFTPSGTFSGTFTVPYIVQSILKSISNQGLLTIVVSGADVATALNGPTAANIGSSLTYTSTTSNVGVETGANVVPKLTLTGDITLPTSMAYTFTASGTGTTKVTTVTFPTIASLAPTDAPVDNSVTFTLNSGSVTGNAFFTTAVPDPSTANNTATLTTTGYNSTASATGCGGPGTDGPGPLGSIAVDGMIINTYFQGQASVAAAAKTIALAGSGTGFDKPIMPGDLLLIMQMQGADVATTNSAAYGVASNITAGTYEYAVAAPGTNVTYAGGGTLVLMKGLVNSYSAAAATSTAGPRRFQVIRVPQYSTYNAASGTTTGAAWNGTTGGVLALDVVGATTFGSTSGSTSFTMTGKGFRGGGGVRYSGTLSGTYTNTDYVNVAAARNGGGAHATKGEGIVGTPRYVSQSATSSLDLGTDAYPGGSVGRGAPGNAGGGGTDATLVTNSGNTGGGGGSNFINANNGGKGGNYNTTATGGLGATASGLSADTRLFMGGGGGAGSTSVLAGTEGSGSGANGGGIIMLRTGTVTGTGTMSALGASAGNTTANAAGGGGGGGAVLIASGNTMANVTINVSGGTGGSTVSNNTLVSYGAGGGGSSGVVYNNGTSGTTDPTSITTFGARGTAKAGTSAAAANGTVAGGTSAAAVTQSTTQNGGISATSACRPDLDVILRANTPQVVRGNAMQATYTLTVVNGGGAAASVNALVTLANGTSATGGSATGTASSLFKYNRTVSATITLTDNSVITLTTTAGALNSYSAPEAADASPTFGDIDLPAGAILTIKFLVDVDTNVENNATYQSGAQVTYLDPTRTAATTTITPGGTYAATGTAPGTNYVSTSSTGEDVAVARPLPVELKQFSALALRQDASLTWTTASEHNNDRFELERSWDGVIFSVIGTVKGQGNSTAGHVYQYVDRNAAALASASVAYYRLHQLDMDGTGAYSPVRLVRFDKSLQAAISLYPNPAQAKLTLNLSSLPAGEYQVSILDMTGRSISQRLLTGQQAHTFPISALPPGSYLVQVKGVGASLTLRLLRE